MPVLDDKRILLILGCLCIFFPGAFVFGFPGVMASEWQAVFGVNKASVGRVMFFILAGTGCSMYLSGRLHERYPTRFLVFFGSTACAVSMLAVADARNIGHVYAWAFSEGFFCGFVYMPCLKFFQQLFPEHKGLATGILNLTFGGAAAVMSPVFTWVYVSFGYAASAFAGGVPALVLGTCGALLIRQTKDAWHPGDIPAAPLPVKTILSIRAFWVLWWIWALAGAAGVSFIVLAASFGEHLGYDITRSVCLLTGFNMLNGLGRMISGRMADLFPRPRVLQVIFLMAAGAYFLLPWFTSLFWLTFLACFIGLSFGALFTVSAPLVTDVFGLENFGRVFGLVFTAYGFVAGLLGPWLSGLILDITHGNYTLVFFLFGTFYLVSSVLILKYLQPSGRKDIRA